MLIRSADPADRRCDSQIDRQKDGLKDADRLTDTETDKQTDTQIDRQTDRHNIGALGLLVSNSIIKTQFRILIQRSWNRPHSQVEKIVFTDLITGYETKEKKK